MSIWKLSLILIDRVTGNCIVIITIFRFRLLISDRTKKMDMLSTLPRHLDTKDLSNEVNSLNVSMPAAAAAALQLSTNFLNAVSI